MPQEIPDFGVPPENWDYKHSLQVFMDEWGWAPSKVGRCFAHDPRWVFDLFRKNMPRVPRKDSLEALWIWLAEMNWKLAAEDEKV